jgi:hypothetical protein
MNDRWPEKQKAEQQSATKGLERPKTPAEGPREQGSVNRTVDITKRDSPKVERDSPKVEIARREFREAGGGGAKRDGIDLPRDKSPDAGPKNAALHELLEPGASATEKRLLLAAGEAGTEWKLKDLGDKRFSGGYDRSENRLQPGDPSKLEKRDLFDYKSPTAKYYRSMVHELRHVEQNRDLLKRHPDAAGRREALNAEARSVSKDEYVKRGLARELDAEKEGWKAYYERVKPGLGNDVYESMAMGEADKWLRDNRAEETQRLSEQYDKRVGAQRGGEAPGEQRKQQDLPPGGAAREIEFFQYEFRPGGDGDRTPSPRGERAFDAQTAKAFEEKYRNDVKPLPGGGCMTAMYKGLEVLYSPATSKEVQREVYLGARRVDPEARRNNDVDHIMEGLRSRSLADAGERFKYVRQDKKWTGLEEGVVGKVSGEKPGWYFFGLSVSGAYHSVILAVDRTKPGAEPRVYWMDQYSRGFEKDVTGRLDEKLRSYVPKSGYAASVLWALKPDVKVEIIQREFRHGGAG